MLDAQRIMREQIAKSLGFFQYRQIMRTVGSVDVSRDEDFQRLFNGYFRIRRNAQWRNAYYSLFQKNKTLQPDFRGIITELYRETENIEASFSSKMLATLNPNRPIWDQFVIKSLGFKTAEQSKEEMLESAIRVYADIETWYSRFLGTEGAQACIDVFDSALPDYSWLSNVKKVDFFLWSSQGTDAAELRC
jgi:hypothetical protein